MDCRIAPDSGLGVQILQVFFSDNRSALADESIDQVSVALIVGKELLSLMSALGIVLKFIPPLRRSQNMQSGQYDQPSSNASRILLLLN